MKKIFYFSLFVASALTFSSCTHEEDDIFDKSAAEILNEVSELYSERLASSEGGWAIEYYPTIIEDFDPNVDNKYQVQGYLLLADFEKDGSVSMGMKNVVSNNAFISDRSAWDVITDLGPVLSFSTYNKCIHPFAQPEESGALDTDKGKGLEGDYEFMMLDVPENPEYIMLKGKKRGTYVRMSRLDADTDFATYYSNLDALNNKYFNPSAPNNLVMSLGENVMNVKGAATGLITTWPADGDEVADAVIRPFLTFVHNGEFRLRFRDAIELEDGSKAQEFAYNEEEDVFKEVENGEFNINGPVALTFFDNHISKGKRWQMQLSENMSDDIKTLIDGLKSDMKNTSSKYEFDVDLTGKKYGISIYKGDNGYQIDFDIKYLNKNKKRQVTLSYEYTYSVDENGLTIGYVRPMTTGSENMLNTFPKIGDVLALLSDTYKMHGLNTNLDLSSVKLTSVSSESKWCVFNNIK
ncbi:MAG: DUF4302 domain-containing protein [Prevotella sp.]